MAKITYDDKISINENADIPAINKCQASDMNEIKSVVNQNYDELQKHSITTYLSSDISFPSSSSNYSMIEVNGSVVTGDKLQIGEKTVNGANYKGIVVGSGVSKIKINATASFRNNNQTSPMYFVLYICRLRGETAEFISRMPTLEVPINGLTDGVSISPFDYEVQEGDLFYLRMYKSIANGNCNIVGNSTERRTYITAEVVE